MKLSKRLLLLFVLVFAVSVYAKDDDDTDDDCDDDCDANCETTTKDDIEDCFDKEKKDQSSDLISCVDDVVKNFKDSPSCADEDFTVCRAYYNKCTQFTGESEKCFVEGLNYLTCSIEKKYNCKDVTCKEATLSVQYCVEEEINPVCACPLLRQGSDCWRSTMRSECTLPDEQQIRDVWRPLVRSTFADQCRRNRDGN